jgi:hypothetical protein
VTLSTYTGSAVHGGFFGLCSIVLWSSTGFASIYGHLGLVEMRFGSGEGGIVRWLALLCLLAAATGELYCDSEGLLYTTDLNLDPVLMSQLVRLP